MTSSAIVRKNENNLKYKHRLIRHSQKSSSVKNWLTRSLMAYILYTYDITNHPFYTFFHEQNAYTKNTNTDDSYPCYYQLHSVISSY